MSTRPARLIFYGYALAAGAAAATHALHGSALVSVLGVWIGGAAAVLLIAVTPGVSRPFRAEAPRAQAVDGPDAADAAALEADRLADRSIPDAKRSGAAV